jgi:carboxypeptidase C (cathepsin A)
MSLVPRLHTWTAQFNVLFVDNPVGVGFSFTTDPDGFVSDEQQVGIDLYTMLEQFYTIFPHLANNPLFIAGESYGGKYAPSAACYIHQQVASGRSSINLVLLCCGDGD